MCQPSVPAFSRAPMILLHTPLDSLSFSLRKSPAAALSVLPFSGHALSTTGSAAYFANSRMLFSRVYMKGLITEIPVSGYSVTGQKHPKTPSKISFMMTVCAASSM